MDWHHRVTPPRQPLKKLFVLSSEMETAFLFFSSFLVHCSPLTPFQVRLHSQFQNELGTHLHPKISGVSPGKLAAIYH